MAHSEKRKEDFWSCDYCESEFDNLQEGREHEKNCKKSIHPIFIRGGKLQSRLDVSDGLRFGLGFGAGIFLWSIIFILLVILAIFAFGGIGALLKALLTSH